MRRNYSARPGNRIGEALGASYPVGCSASFDHRSTSARIGECNEESEPSFLLSFDVAMADGLGARCPPSCFFMGARLPNADIRHAIPERQAVTDQCREVVAKELVAHDLFGVSAVIGLERSDGAAFDFGNVDHHELGHSGSIRIGYFR